MRDFSWGAGHCPARPFFFLRLTARGVAALAAVCMLHALPAPSRADFAEGLAAYDGGDYRAAYRAWLPLAKAGDGDAQAAVAALYLSELLDQPAGANERRRIQRTAAHWYRQAARCGHVVAQLNLGELYSTGIGVARDLSEARFWLGLAARGGNRWAAGRAARVDSQLKPAQRAAATARLDSWTPDPGCRVD